MPEPAPATAWTCERCEVTATWMPGVEAPPIPPNWSDEHGVLHCLGCRRELAGETGVADLPENAPAEDRRKQHTHSRIEFEIQLYPERPDQQIAKACRTSIVAVRRARERLGIPRVDATAQGSRP
ncbi:MAG: hypothetical protein FJW90_06840 [Actinobacteria bacterium]|nr:hypothetical protein [Actinomycetota bacterium]